MYARLISFSGADAGQRENTIQTIREMVLPTLQGFAGFKGYASLYDTDSGQARAILLWESKEAAEAAEPDLVERRERITSGMGLTIESVELYEVLVLEMA